MPRGEGQRKGLRNRPLQEAGTAESRALDGPRVVAGLVQIRFEAGRRHAEGERVAGQVGFPRTDLRTGKSGIFGVETTRNGG